MATILASASNADAATTTTSSFPFDAANVITATCANSATAPPSTPCQATIQLSSDNVVWKDIEARWYGLAPGITYVQRFELSNYVTVAQQYGYSAWNYYRIKFAGNTGAAVTIAASDSITTTTAILTLTGLNSTTGGAIGSWTPPQGGPVIINNVVVYCTANSGGAANLSVGVAANAATNSVTLINASAVGAAANSIIVSGTGNSATVQGLLTTTQALTFTGSANSVGFAAKAYITYTKV